MHPHLRFTAFFALASASPGVTDDHGPVAVPTTCWRVLESASAPIAGRVEAEAEGSIECAVPAHWDGRGLLRLHVTSDRPVTLEVAGMEPDGKAGFWRRVDLVPGGQDLALPLRWFRWRDGRVARWEAVDRIGIRFRGPASIVLGEGALEAGSPVLGVADLEALAGVPMRHLESPRVRLLTSAPDADLDQLLAHLEAVGAALAADLPFLEPPSRPVPLVVLGDRRAYQDFTVALARAYGAVTDPPSTDGFTLQGVALTSWDRAWGTLRPSYTHEFAHAWLTAASALPSDRGDWFQEGIASRLQIRFHPQDDLASIVRDGLADPAHRLPLAELLDGRRLPGKRYWQAMTVVDLLLATQPDAMPALLHAMSATGRPDLLPHLGPVLHTDLATFETAWKEETARRYAAGAR